MVILLLLSHSTWAVNSLDIFPALLKKDAVLKSLEGDQQGRSSHYKIPKSILVKARFINTRSRRVFILDQEGRPKYSTDFENLENLQHVTTLHPQIDPLEIVEEKIERNKLSGVSNNKLSHFLSLSRLQGTSNFQAQLLGGTSDKVSGFLLNTKNYYITDLLPIHLGFNLGFHSTSWDDEEIGSLSSRAFHLGPSILYSFFEGESSRFNLHVNFFQSLQHRLNQSPSPIELATNGWQLDLEREFLWNGHPVFLAVNYRWSSSKVTSFDQTLDLPQEDLPEKTFGLTVGYRFNWAL